MILNGKAAVVTGSARGIGREYAVGLAREGARLALADLNEAGISSVAKEIEAEGGEAIAVATDITDVAAFEILMKTTAEAYGQIDVLVNNAALFADDVAGWNPVAWDPLNGDLEQWHQINSVNVDGVLNGMRAAAPYMIERGNGKIINQSSGAAYMDAGAYGFTKAAVNYLTRIFALRLAKDNIQVNAIAPGAVMTDAMAKRGNRSNAEAEAYLNVYADTIPAGRIAQPSDLVGTAIYLASSLSDYVTGQIISVDGGWHYRS